jgi:hypothetical protein
LSLCLRLGRYHATIYAIYRIVGGEYSGEYVMGCATESCGYLSMSFIFTLHRVVLLNAPSYPKFPLKMGIQDVGFL